MAHLIFSWNIDSLKPEKWTKLVSFIEKNNPSIVCLNETKGKFENLAKLFAELTDYDHIINAHSPAQYHGVAILIHKNLDWDSLDIKLDCEARSDNRSKDPTIGRLSAILLKANNFVHRKGSEEELEVQDPNTFSKDVGGDLVIVATYSPNSGIDYTNPLKNLTYRIESWDASLFKTLVDLETKYKNVIWIGDINVAPTELDVSHPKVFARHAGFTQEERDSFAQFLQKSGWIDIWRYQHPHQVGYTFKGYKGYRYRLRLDNCVITPSLLTRASQSTIYADKDFLESDHNPISILLANPE